MNSGHWTDTYINLYKKRQEIWTHGFCDFQFGQIHLTICQSNQDTNKYDHMNKDRATKPQAFQSRSKLNIKHFQRFQSFQSNVRGLGNISPNVCCQIRISLCDINVS